MSEVPLLFVKIGITCFAAGIPFLLLAVVVDFWIRCK